MTTIQEAMKTLRKTKSLKNIDKEFRNKREVALEAVRIDGINIKYLMNSLQHDYEILAEALFSNEETVYYIDTNYLFKDQDFISYLLNNQFKSEKGVYNEN